jgi:hypothetical protein
VVLSSGLTFAIPAAVVVVQQSIQISSSVFSGASSGSSTVSLSSSFILTEVLDFQQNLALFAFINSDSFPT